MNDLYQFAFKSRTRCQRATTEGELVLEDKIRPLMTEERFRHVKETLKIAQRISNFSPIEKKKLEIACLLHDIAKDIPFEKMEGLVKKYGIAMDEIERKEFKLWHGLVGAFMIENDFDIKDLDILEAVKVHSTGKPNMPVLTKILYIADYLETCPDKEIEAKAKENIDSAVKIVTSRKIEYVLKKGSSLHLRSVSLWNSLIV